MRKKKSILVREILKGGEINVNKLSESPFIHLMACIEGLEVTDNMEIKSLIKANINDFNVNELLVVENKVTGEKENFRFYISTTSQIKNCEGWFVKEEYISLINKIEYIASTGKLFELNGEDVAVNKDIIARLSLLFTGSYKTNIIPNIIVVKDVDYSVKRNVKIFENDELVNKDDYKLDVTAFDGCGIASDKMFRRISKELRMDYIPSWVTVRSPKMAIKGLLTNVNFKQYFEDKYINDTETFKKIGNDFFIKDCFGDFQKVDDNTIIINESMAKWSKFYNSMNEYDEKQMKQFAKITDCLYIAKYAKETAKEYTSTSYQSLNAMALTPQALQNISKPSIDFYHRVCNFEKVAVLEMLKLISSSEENEDEIKVTADKISTLLSIDFERFVEMNWVKKTLIGMIERKIKEIMSGKFLVEGDFKVCVACPITFMNYVMNGCIVPELKEKEFYTKGQVGKVACVRFPVASPYELTVETLISNETLDKYCNYTNEMIVVNQVGVDAMIKSGADFDGDIWQCIRNEEIIKSIIPCERIFVNTADGATAKVKYDWNNRVKANIEIKGNIIGKLAISASTIGDKCQDINKFIEDNQVVTYQEIRERFETNEECYEYLKTLTKLTDMPEDFIRQHIINEFALREKEINKLVMLSMCAIDAPKTLVKPDLSVIADTLEEYKMKPRFFHFLPDKDYKLSTCGHVYSVLSSQCGFLFNTLWKRFSVINGLRSYMNDKTFNTVMANALLLEVNIENVEAIKEVISKSYQRFNKDIELMKASSYIFDANGNVETEIIDGKEVYKEEHRYTEEEKISIYKNACLSSEICSLELYETYSLNDVTYAVASLALEGYKNSHRYIFDFFFRSVIQALELEIKTVTQLKENANGEYQGMFKRYDLVSVENNVDMAEKNTIKMVESIQRRFEGTKKLRMFLSNPDALITNQVEIRGLEVYLDGEKVGNFFADALSKNNLTVSDVQGIVKVQNFVKASSGKSAEIIIGEVA